MYIYINLKKRLPGWPPLSHISACSRASSAGSANRYARTKRVAFTCVYSVYYA